MARPYFKAEHVREFKDLPAKPVKGRAYFIDDEGCIAVDYGDTRGVQLYGNKIGIQGSTGELVLQMRANIQDLFEKLIPLLQDTQENESSTQEQIDALSFANIQNSINSINAHDRRKSEIKNEAAIRAEEDAKLKTQISEINENIKSEAKNHIDLQEQSDSLSESNLQNTLSIHNEAEQRREDINELQSDIDKHDEQIEALIEADKKLNSEIQDVTALQSQTDSLAETGLNNALNISSEAEARRENFQKVTAQIENIHEFNQAQQIQIDILASETQNINNLTDNASVLQKQSDSLAEGELNNSINISNEAQTRRENDEKLKQQINTLAQSDNIQIDTLSEANLNNSSNIAYESEIRRENIKRLDKRDNELQAEIISLAKKNNGPITVSSLQEQADLLAETGLNNALNLQNEAQNRRDDILKLQEHDSQNEAAIRAQTNSLAEANLSNTASIHNEAELRRQNFREIKTISQFNQEQQQIQADLFTEAGLNNSVSISNEAQIRRKTDNKLNSKIESVRRDEVNNNSALQNQNDLIAKTILESYLGLWQAINKIISETQTLHESDSSQLEQIDTIAEANLNNSASLHNEAEARRSLNNKIETLANENISIREQIQAIIDIGTSDIRKFCERSKNLQNEIDSLSDNETALQAQNDSLAEANLNNSANLHNEAEQRRKNSQEIESIKQFNNEQQKQIDSLSSNEPILQIQADLLAETGLNNSLNIVQETNTRREALEQRKKMLSQEIFTRIEQDDNLQSQIDLLCETCMQILIIHRHFREKINIADNNDVYDMLNQTYNS